MQSSNLELKNHDEELLSKERITLQEIGSVLKDTREKKSLTLKEVKKITCIPVHHILAIENGARENLPEDFYLIGFLKRYAKALGLNEKSITNMYSNNSILINTETRKDENNKDFDLLFDNGGDRNNLFKRERKKLNTMDKEKSFFSIFHFYLLLGVVLFVTAIYSAFNLIVNNPFDSKNKTFKQVIVENEHEEEFKDENLTYQDEEITEHPVDTANDDPEPDVVLEFKKVKGSPIVEDEEYEEIAVNDEIDKNVDSESKIVIKNFSTEKSLPANSVQELVKKPINDIERLVVKPKMQEQVKVAKSIPAQSVQKPVSIKSVQEQVKVVKSIPTQSVQKPVSIKPVQEQVKITKTIQVKKQPIVKSVVVAKPVQQQVKIAKTIQLKTTPVAKAPLAIKQVASKPAQKTSVSKPDQVKPQQAKLVSNQKFCAIKKTIVKPQTTKLVQAPKVKVPQKVVQNVQKPIVVEVKKPVEVQKVAKNSPSKSELALRVTQSPVVKPQPQESTASDEIMLRPLRIVE